MNQGFTRSLIHNAIHLIESEYSCMAEKCASKTSIVENKNLHRNISIKINESIKLNPIAGPGLVQNEKGKLIENDWLDVYGRTLFR